MKKYIFVSAAALVLLTLFQIGRGRSNAPMAITPVPLPNPNIPGFQFPEDSNKLNTWVKNEDAGKIVLHGWGVWTALGMNSGQSYNGVPLRVFETWMTPEEISQAIASAAANPKFVPEQLQVPRRSRLMVPHQFIHAREMKGLSANALIPPADSARVLGFVKYDPSAALFTIKNKLYNGSVLQKMLNQGQADVPQFPNTAVALKPVFKIITKSSLVNGYFKLSAWSGPPPVPGAYPETDWPGCVYVDLNNKGQGDGSIDIGCKGRTPRTTYNLKDFISFPLDKQEAADLRNLLHIAAAEGDMAILVAMHVTTKEIRRWTWQTFWWAPNADKPPFPSTAFVASARPAQLTGPARHYAMSIAYTFIEPDQPFTGGNNIGKSLYVYNPYLEAGFDATTFYQPAIVKTGGVDVLNQYGIQTNCMSCHALANYNPNNIPTGPQYMADTYIDMQGARFKGVLQTDFLWSIPQNATAGSTNFLRLKNAGAAKKKKQ